MTTTALLDEAKSLLIHGDHTGSIKSFTEAIESGAATATNYLSRGVAFMLNDNSECALEDFEKAVELNPNSARAHYYRGLAFMRLKNFLRAVHEFTRALEITPHHGMALLARSLAYSEMGLNEEATVDLKGALVIAQVSGQRFVDSMGMIRTQLDKAFHLWIGEARDPRITPEEYEQLRGMIDEMSRN